LPGPGAAGADEPLHAAAPDATRPHPAPATVAIVVGTRQEAIKMAPVVAALRARPHAFRPLLVATSQHREMLTQALDVFGLVPDVDLGLMQTGQELSSFTARAMAALAQTFLEHRPDWLLVQGDTSTVTAAALAAFYQGIPVGHVEAGLRSFDLSSPFPEEVNRRVATTVASLHFAPTTGAREHLVAEGVPEADILVTGNTVVDALRMAPRVAHFSTPVLERVLWQERRVVLVTMHRRENLGAPLRALCEGLRGLVSRDPSVHLVFPVHLNPRVREVVHEVLGDPPSITLCEPLPYMDLLEVMRRATLILSDSGGIQEEAPALRTPILILRDTTERPEVVTSGFGELIGTDPTTVITRAERLLRAPDERARMTAGANPFGDGLAAERIADALEARLHAAGAPRLPRRLDRHAVSETLDKLALAS
jgi:UDP-N-acetylglucosamine 2-epimerase (non-hydrolysing)